MFSLPLGTLAALFYVCMLGGGVYWAYCAPIGPTVHLLGLLGTYWAYCAYIGPTVHLLGLLATYWTYWVRWARVIVDNFV